MNGQFWLTEGQVERLRPHFSEARGKPRVDDRQVLSGILHILRNGLRWQDAPVVYGPHKTLYNRFVRWSRLGVFARLFGNLALLGRDGDRIMMNSAHLKAHRTAASLRKGGSGRRRSGALRVAWTQSCTCSAMVEVDRSTSSYRRDR